jgi:uncharacterized protein YndB with AHSA1/START domain
VNDREVEVSRHFDAPPEVLWEAWTNPDRVVEWWGPEGFTTTNHEMDVRPGGVWSHTMHGPDGTDYPSRAVFSEVLRPRRIAYALEGGSETARVHCEVFWTFAPVSGGTLLTMRMRFPSIAARNRAIDTLGVEEAGVMTLERLATHL